jgi:hypothetical protein
VKPDAARVSRGAEVYKQFCSDCHGGPGPDKTWLYQTEKDGNDGGLMTKDSPKPWHGKLVPHELLQTDPERITFRYGDIAPFQLYRRFTFRTELGDPYTEFGGYPVVHQLQFERKNIRFSGAYINGPIDGVFARAPYLHNASVPTLAQLINLKPRPAKFYRGRNVYDLDEIGLACPDKPDRERYYPFDTTLPGNKNTGHDYPWAYRGPGWNEDALKDLLEFLKTL